LAKEINFAKKSGAPSLDWLSESQKEKALNQDTRLELESIAYNKSGLVFGYLFTPPTVRRKTKHSK
jgi:hypothetical protein